MARMASMSGLDELASFLVNVENVAFDLFMIVLLKKTMDDHNSVAYLI